MHFMTIENVLHDCESLMDSTIRDAIERTASVRIDRADPAIFERLLVECYDGKSPIRDLATISSPERKRTVIVTPFDRNLVPRIKTAMGAAEPNAALVVDGTSIVCTLPPITEERRRECIEISRTICEHSKASIRALRRETRKNLDSLHGISSDDIDRARAKIETLTSSKIEILDVAQHRKKILIGSFEEKFSTRWR